MSVLGWIGVSVALYLAGWGAIVMVDEALERLEQRFAPGSGRRRRTV